MTGVMDLYSLYLHIPFCKKRCHYCDFSTRANLETLMPPYTRALCKEVCMVARAAEVSLPVHSVYFGGGTPSYLPANELEHILTTINQNFSLVEDCENTLEANPGTLDGNSLRVIRKAGFNRLSLGVQSFQETELRLLGRIHSALDVFDAVRLARKSGFSRLSLDLIYGLPGQTMKAWKSNLEVVLSLRPEHISLYALTLEENVLLERWVRKGLVPAIDEDMQADHYEWASEFLKNAGFVQYEISNWAYEGMHNASRHNLQYWRNLPYLGFGAAAHGSASGQRYSNDPDPASYIQKVREENLAVFPAGPAVIETIPISGMEEMRETMMLGLRLVCQGVSKAAFRERFGVDMLEIFGKEIEDLLRRNLIEWAGGEQTCLRLTHQARLIGNQVFIKFVSD